MDPVAVYEVLIREHEPMLMAYILSLVSDPTLAEDIAQETFLVAYRKLATLQKKESFGAWLRGIARFEALAAMRKQSREVAVEPAVVEAMEDVFRRLEQIPEPWEERFKVVEDCFKLLPEGLQTVCRLHYFESYRTNDIAQQLQLGLSAVLKRLERGRTGRGNSKRSSI